MKDNDLKRREFLQLLLAAPLALSAGCGSKSVDAPILSPEESLKKLIKVLGPDSPGEKSVVDSFAARFLKGEKEAGTYLPASNETLQSLAAHFSNDAAAVDKIDLKKFSTEERELLLQLAKHLYNLVDVRFYVSGDKQLGTCGERRRHTKAPEL